MPPSGGYPGAGGMYFLILAAFLWIEQSGGGVGAMGRNTQVQTQQSRASGAVN